ncbi:MAG: DUF3667 domain-containing protein [Sphingomicrobium sp.]
MGEFEALGDVVTGGVVGRAVEPKAGEGADGHTHETACLNCGAALAGAYCHDCGQHAHVHRTLGAFFHDFLHGVLHFEGKVWHTLPMLAWRPGELTRRYIDGQRARFVSPIALFLFSIFLMFAVVSASGALEKSPEQRASISDSAAKTERTIKTLEAERTSAAKAGPATTAIDHRLIDARAELAALNGLSGKDMGLDRNVTLSNDLPSWLREPIEQAAANPALLFYKLKTNAYKFSWALIPLSVPFLWLLFPFSRRFRLYDHTIFVTYSLCFMTLLVVAAVIVGAVAPAVAGLAMLIPPFHMYRQLRGTYGVGRFGALWRTIMLLIFALVAALLFVALLFALGLFD